MNHDEVTGAVLAAVDASAPQPHMRTPIQQIFARAQSHRRRRRLTGLAGAGVAAGLGLALAFSAVVGGSAGTVPGPSNVKLAAWTVRTGTDGTVTVTVRQLFNAAGLQQALAAHHVPAIVHFGVLCDPAGGKSLPQITGVLGLLDTPSSTGPTSRNPIMLRIHPAAMPNGARLDFSVLRGATAIQLLPAGVGVTCHPPASSGQGSGGRPATSAVGKRP